MPSRAEVLCDTPQGPGRIVTRRATRGWASLILTHGAGGGIDSHDLLVLDEYLPRRGISVTRIEMPWKVAGRRIAPAPAVLDVSFTALVDHLRPRVPIVVGGRSAGARVACRRGRSLGASGVLALAFPLHPPGKPERTRIEELTSANLPVRVVQGTRDPFGTPAEFPADVDVVALPGADHALAVGKRATPDQATIDAMLVEAVHGFVRSRVPVRRLVPGE